MLTIGKLAHGAGVTADAVRYYEQERLLAPAQKTAAGYRLYGQDAARRLRFIKHAQQCGFSLAEIRELLELRATGRSCCRDVRAVAIAKRSQLEGKIKALRELLRALGRLINVCVDDVAALDACPILGALERALEGGSGPRCDGTRRSEAQSSPFRKRGPARAEKSRVSKAP
ncbi:MAG TPA: heavy metal-responsive transcriptional regulator [Burkholderiales bacterium]|nr:heavy metal-responsive transcriptional regulator [Burkholderiales bacterium]